MPLEQGKHAPAYSSVWQVRKLRSEKKEREGAPVTWIKLFDDSHSSFSKLPPSEKNLKVG